MFLLLYVFVIGVIMIIVEEYGTLRVVIIVGLPVVFKYNEEQGWLLVSLFVWCQTMWYLMVTVFTEYGNGQLKDNGIPYLVMLRFFGYNRAFAVFIALSFIYVRGG